MTDSNYTHLLTIVDRSGSMMSCHVEMRNALDALFAEQAKLEGRCLVDYVQFDNIYEKVFSDIDVSKARAVLDPRGSTALLDAIGRAVVELGEKLAALLEDQRPGKVIVAVITDGFENASQEWTPEKVRALIKDQTDKYSWDFTFLGANIDAVKVGGMFGFQPDKSLTFNTDRSSDTVSTLSSYVGATRSGVNAGYSDEDRERVL